MFFDNVIAYDYEDESEDSSLEISLDERLEQDLKTFCHNRLRSLSVGSAVFNENDSILSTTVDGDGSVFKGDGSVVHKVCESGMCLCSHQSHF